MKVVDFKKGIFSVTPNGGVVISEGVLSEAVRRSGFTPTKIVVPGGLPTSKKQQSPPLPLSGNQANATALAQELASARDAFRRREYNLAVERVLEVAGAKDYDPQIGQEKIDKNNKQGEKSILANPRIAEIQQLLSLASFAQGKYQEAFTAAHVALYYGISWDWKHLSGHYEKPTEYSAQLRALEQQIREKPSVELRILIGYHYQMLGSTKAARSQLARAAEELARAGDEKPYGALVRKMLRQLEQEPGSKNP